MPSKSHAARSVRAARIFDLPSERFSNVVRRISDLALEKTVGMIAIMIHGAFVRLVPCPSSERTPAVIKCWSPFGSLAGLKLG